MSFSGKTVRLERFRGDFDFNEIVDATAVVGVAVEEFNDTRNLDKPGGVSVLNADINLGGDRIIFNFDEVRSFRVGNSDGFNGYVISDADGEILPISGVSVNSLLTNLDFSADRVFFSPDKVFIDIDNLQFNSDERTFTLDVDFTESPDATADFEEALFVARLYTATFGRDPDFDFDAAKPDGLNFWINRSETLGTTELVRQFLISDEFEQRFGAPQDLDAFEFVNQMYLNVLGRQGEAAGVNFWSGLLGEGEISQRDVLEFFVTAPENVENTTRFDEGLVQNAENGEWGLFI